MRCLIVDDSVQFCAAASVMLERAGMTVEVASDSGEALRCYLAHRPDVTLVDVDLGAESGFDIVEQLHRAVPSGTPVILISTHDEQDLADMIASSSAVGFLPKIALSPDAIQNLLSLRR